MTLHQPGYLCNGTKAVATERATAFPSVMADGRWIAFTARFLEGKQCGAVRISA